MRVSTKNRLTEILVLTLAALSPSCGGAALPEEARSASDEDEDAPIAADTDEAAPEKEGASDTKPADEPSGDAPVASNDDLQKVLQLVIDDLELDKFLHLDQPGRFPLAISGDIPADLELTKSTQPVKRVDGAAGKDKAVLVFTEITVDGKQATVKYRFDIEGIRGAAYLKKGQFGWELSSSRIIER